jgi:hypothetical protein
MRVSSSPTSRLNASTSKIPPQAVEAGAGLVQSLVQFGCGEHVEVS